MIHFQNKILQHSQAFEFTSMKALRIDKYVNEEIDIRERNASADSF